MERLSLKMLKCIIQVWFLSNVPALFQAVHGKSYSSFGGNSLHNSIPAVQFRQSENLPGQLTEL